METKLCPTCNIEKPKSDFAKYYRTSDGLQYECKACNKETKAVYRQTYTGYMKQLAQHAKRNAKKRGDAGRNDAGVCEICFDDLDEMWTKQNGRCYYSNIPMNIDRNDWKVSVERLDPSQGYTKQNTALCCIEFNNSSQWSLDKIQEMKNILASNPTGQTHDFEVPPKQRKTRVPVVKSEINGIDHYNCTYCGQIKPLSEFHARINNGCIPCQKILKKQYDNTPRGALKCLLLSSLSNNAKRLALGNTERDCSHDIDFEFLVELYNKQNGLCAYSGIPMTFGSYLDKNWVCSLERKDPLKGYTKDNVCLICVEFNTKDSTAVYNDKTKGSSGWNREKFLTFYNSIMANQ